jgi:hypothetical protein
MDSMNVVGLMIQMSVNRRNRYHVGARTTSAMGKIRYTRIPLNDCASIRESRETTMGIPFTEEIIPLKKYGSVQYGYDR